MNLPGVLAQGGIISVLVAVLLLLMSVASWVVIVWKSWMLHRAVGDVARSTAAFWQSASVDEAGDKVAAFDREALVLPLIEATKISTSGTLATAGDKSQQLTRVLRDALHAVLHKLQFGQVLLATVGSIAPFVGLLGTVWGIYHALIGNRVCWPDHHRQGVRPGGRGAHHDGGGPRGGDSRSAGLQHLRTFYWPHRSRPRRFRP